jgi:hypothetical protein
MIPNKKTIPTKRTNRSSKFSKGTSGNPSGRPLGSRNHATVLMESLLEGKAEELLQKAVEMALAGDTTALRLCMDRLMPPRKDRPIKLSLPPIDTVQQISLAVGKVAQSNRRRRDHARRWRSVHERLGSSQGHRGAIALRTALRGNAAKIGRPGRKSAR